MNELLVITIGYAVSLVLIIWLGTFVLLKDWKNSTNRLFFLMCLSIAGFQISFIFGANTADPSLAYWFWFANLSDIFIGIFYLHFIVLALHVMPKYKWVVRATYVIGLGIFAACILYPASFLLRVIPKMYFKTYLDGGPLYAVMLGFFLLCFLISLIIMFLEQQKHSIEGKRRTDYHIFAVFYGLATGVTAFPLVFNVPFNPMPSLLVGTFVIPMVYGMIKKDLLDIRIVARRTTIFTVMIFLITAAVTAVSLLSNYLSEHIPGFSYWMVPFLTALVATLVGYLYWQKSGEAEILKYEFINISTHKFRTPLTRIRWAAEAMLARADLPKETRGYASHIRESVMELIHLSNLLMNAVHVEKELYTYTHTNFSLKELVENVLVLFQTIIANKNIKLTVESPSNLPLVRGDRERLSSALHVFVENAVNYTPHGGNIDIKMKGYVDAIYLEITDSGIGISPDEKMHLFNKFYRSERAQKIDTGGVGVGLSIAKNIIERHRGTVGVSSKGTEKGSTFWFTLPISVK